MKTLMLAFWMTLSGAQVCSGERDVAAKEHGMPFTSGLNMLQTDRKVSKSSSTQEIEQNQEFRDMQHAMTNPTEKSHNDLNLVEDEQLQAPRREDHLRIICPFLGTLINEGDLPVKSSYTKQELQDITVRAGQDPAKVEGHIQGNFKDIPSNVIDIFDMEGLPNEHFTSTGINDCNTCVFNCRKHAGGHQECETETKNKNNCGVPSQSKFDEFFQIADADHDNVLTATELEDGKENFPANDFNGIGGGTISGSFQFLIDIFGDPPGQRITKEALKTINIDRNYPDYYTFP